MAFLLSGWEAELTDLLGDLCDTISGQIQYQKVLEARDEIRDLMQSGPVNLPLLDLTELDQTAWQWLKEGDESEQVKVSVVNQWPSGPGSKKQQVKPSLPSTPPARYRGWVARLLSSASLSIEPEPPGPPKHQRSVWNQNQKHEPYPGVWASPPRPSPPLSLC